MTEISKIFRSLASQSDLEKANLAIAEAALSKRMMIQQKEELHVTAYKLTSDRPWLTTKTLVVAGGAHRMRRPPRQSWRRRHCCERGGIAVGASWEHTRWKGGGVHWRPHRCPSHASRTWQRGAYSMLAAMHQRSPLSPCRPSSVHLMPLHQGSEGHSSEHSASSLACWCSLPQPSWHIETLDL